MTIDEAINDFKKMAENARNDIINGDNLEPQEKHYNSQLELYAKEKEQLAEWLEELKSYRSVGVPLLQYLHDGDIYNKALDDLIEAAEKSQYGDVDGKEYVMEHLKALAERLKVDGVDALVEAKYQIYKNQKEMPIATIKFSKEDMQELVDEKVKEIEIDIQAIKNKAIDDFAELLKGKLVHKYANANEVQQYVAMQVTDWCNEISEQLKSGGENE